MNLKSVPDYEVDSKEEINIYFLLVKANKIVSKIYYVSFIVLNLKLIQAPLSTIFYHINLILFSYFFLSLWINI